MKPSVVVSGTGAANPIIPLLEGVARRDQRKLLLQIEGREKVYADRQIAFDHMADANFGLLVVVKGAA